jgi:hypothetical protein
MFSHGYASYGKSITPIVEKRALSSAQKPQECRYDIDFVLDNGHGMDVTP